MRVSTAPCKLPNTSIKLVLRRSMAVDNMLPTDILWNFYKLLQTSSETSETSTRSTSSTSKWRDDRRHRRSRRQRWWRRRTTSGRSWACSRSWRSGGWWSYQWMPLNKVAKCHILGDAKISCMLVIKDTWFKICIDKTAEEQIQPHKSVFVLFVETFLSDPGVPGVRSMGLGLCPSLTHYKTFCWFNWCDSGWWG